MSAVHADVYACPCEAGNEIDPQRRRIKRVCFKDWARRTVPGGHTQRTYNT